MIGVQWKNPEGWLDTIFRDSKHPNRSSQRSILMQLSLRKRVLMVRDGLPQIMLTCSISHKCNSIQILDSDLYRWKCGSIYICACAAMTLVNYLFCGNQASTAFPAFPFICKCDYLRLISFAWSRHEESGITIHQSSRWRHVMNAWGGRLCDLLPGRVKSPRRGDCLLTRVIFKNIYMCVTWSIKINDFLCLWGGNRVITRIGRKLFFMVLEYYVAIFSFTSIIFTCAERNKIRRP
jgi:hypothetical protein